MRQQILTITALLALTATATAADPVVGLWKTQPDEGRYAHIDLHECGDMICGTVAEVFDEHDRSMPSDSIGRQIVWDMQPNGNGKYRKGRIYRVSNDKTYKSKMILDGNRLIVKGCIGPICKKQNWTRVE